MASQTPATSQWWHSSMRLAPLLEARMLPQDVGGSNGAEGLRPEWSDHERIDQAHGDPAELGHDHGSGDREHRAQFGPEVQDVILWR